MNLFVRKNIYHLLDRYDVLDESGQLIYTADGFLTRLHGRLILRDKYGIEVMRLRKRFNPFFAKYALCTAEEPDIPIVAMRQRFSFCPHFSIVYQDVDYELRGNLRASNFDIHQADTLCSRVLKREMSWGDTYVVTLTDPDVIPVFASIAIALDNALYHNH